jgi:hypothetical protein
MVEEKITEGTTEEKDVEEIKEDIVDNYIEHIRNISELSDTDMASVINQAIEEDEELLNIIRKFLEKSGRISELSNDIEGEEEDTEKKEKINAILNVFDDSDYAYSLVDIIKSLNGAGYPIPGDVIVESLSDDILYVDDIDENETIYLALTKKGGSLWESLNK